MDSGKGHGDGEELENLIGKLNAVNQNAVNQNAVNQNAVNQNTDNK
jgi:hypothetical protein